MDELQYLTVKMQNRGASANFGQFEATPESRKLANIYLEKLASSIARSTESNTIDSYLRPGSCSA